MILVNTVIPLKSFVLFDKASPGKNWRRLEKKNDNVRNGIQ